MATPLAVRPAPRPTRATKRAYASWLDNACTHGTALSSDGVTPYTIRRDPETDTYSCSCEGNRVWGAICYHITTLAAMTTPVPAPLPFGHCYDCGERYDIADDVPSVRCPRCERARLQALAKARATSYLPTGTERQKESWL